MPRLGGTKDILREEQPTIDFAYASVVSIRDISEGEALSGDSIWVKRPGTGEILAAEYEAILGKVALRDYRTRYPDPSGGHWLNPRKAVKGSRLPRPS